MYTCAHCTVHACEQGKREDLPKNCPMNDMENMSGILNSYIEPETNNFTLTAASVESEGYRNWPRLKETIEFCKRMGYERVGMAFCGGLKQEAKIVPLATIPVQRSILRIPTAKPNLYKNLSPFCVMSHQTEVERNE